MTALFTTVLRMSFYGALTAVLAAAVFLLLRRSRCSKTVLLLLWAAAALRLTCPWFPSSPVSVLNLVPASLTQQTADAAPVVQPSNAVPVIEPSDNVLTPARPQGSAISAPGPAASPQSSALLAVLPWIWLTGTTIMVGYGVLSYLRLRRRLRFAVRDEADPQIWYSDRICSPCVAGLLRPKIYLTFGLTEQETGHILAHERQHLRNRDHLWKALGWLILSIHWFNPLLWLCWPCFLRALEEACDQRVLRALGEEQKTDYCQSLLALASGRRFRPGISPLAFGEGDTKGRVRSILRYKKPLTAVTVCVLVAAAAAAVVLTTGRADTPGVASAERDPLSPATTVPSDDVAVSFTAVVVSSEDNTLVVEPEKPLPGGANAKRFTFEWPTDEYPVGCRVAVFARGLTAYGETGGFAFVDELVPISGIAAQWQVDLDHDGRDENLSVIDAGYTCCLLVQNENGDICWHDMAARAHAGQNGYYLCQRDGYAYLLQWVPYMSSGYASYSYRLFSLTEEGSGHPLVFQSGSFEGDYVDPMSIDPDELAAFQSQINALLADSVLLMSTNGDTDEVIGDPEHPIPAPAWSCQEEIDYFAELQKLIHSPYTFTAEVVDTGGDQKPGSIMAASDSILTNMGAENPYGYDLFVCTLPVDDASLYHEGDTVTVTADGPLYRWELPDDGTHVSVTLDTHGSEENS